MIEGVQSSMAVSQDMMLQMREKMFEKLDGDGDGSIDLAQLASELETQGGDNARFSEMIDHLKAADTDGDGCVSQEEFNAMEPPPPPMDQAPPSFMYAEDADLTESTTQIGTLLELLG